MAKIRITEKQYQTILLNEQKSRLSTNIISEGFKDVLMGFSTILGVPLTGKNKIDGDRALDSNEVILDIKKTLEDKHKLDNLISALEEKGMENPKTRLAKNAQKIINDFNDLAIAKDLEHIGMSALINLEDLDKSLKGE